MGALTHNGEVLQSLPANASQINFDKTGTNLNSTQTEAAIKEVNTKVNTNTDDITQLKSGLTNYGFTDSITTHSVWIPTSITDITDYAGKVIYGYMTDATLGKTYTFAVPVNNMPLVQTPVWIQHDTSDIGNNNSILVAKSDITNEFCVYLGSNIPDMTLYLFVH